MVKFAYIGDDNEPPVKTTAFGHKFILNGPAVEVEDALAIEKLSGNATFQEVGDDYIPNQRGYDAPAPVKRAAPKTEEAKELEVKAKNKEALQKKVRGMNRKKVIEYIEDNQLEVDHGNISKLPDLHEAVIAAQLGEIDSHAQAEADAEAAEETLPGGVIRDDFAEEPEEEGAPVKKVAKTPAKKLPKKAA